MNGNYNFHGWCLIMNKFLRVLISKRNSLNIQTNEQYVKEIAFGDEIPQVIHQTYFLSPQDELFPEELRENVERLKALNPNWEYRFYNDDDIISYIKKHYPNLLVFYERIDPSYGAARADFFRYLLIYNEGGVYLDIKSNVSRPLKDIIQKDDKYLLSHWPSYLPARLRGVHSGITHPIGEYQQWHIVSVPGHPFLKNVINNVCWNIENYNPIFHDFGTWGVLNLTGPIAYTEAIYPIVDNYEHRIERDNTVLGFEYYSLNDDRGKGRCGHHEIFSRRHYSKNENPIVNVSVHIKIMFLCFRPFIKWLKTIFSNSI